MLLEVWSTVRSTAGSRRTAWAAAARADSDTLPDMRVANVALVMIVVAACSSSGGTPATDGGGGAAGGAAGAGGGAAGAGGGTAGAGGGAAGAGGGPTDAADGAADAPRGDAASEAAGDGPSTLGAPCRAGDTCGGPPLGCDYGVGLTGTCMHCGGPGEVCCNSTGIATGDCTGGRVCMNTVDTARHCSPTPADAGPG
jgi:hypothetical protein